MSAPSRTPPRTPPRTSTNTPSNKRPVSSGAEESNAKRQKTETEEHQEYEVSGDSHPLDTPHPVTWPQAVPLFPSEHTVPASSAIYPGALDLSKLWRIKTAN